MSEECQRSVTKSVGPTPSFGLMGLCPPLLEKCGCGDAADDDADATGMLSTGAALAWPVGDIPVAWLLSLSVEVGGVSSMVRGEGFEGDIPVASSMTRGESFEAFEERPS
jgi:hypothetical protein